MSVLAQFHHQFTGSETSEKKLVFLHGLMGYGANWRRIAKSFSEEFHILYYDQRGHGRSISPKSGYAPEDFAGDLKAILDELGWEKIHLVGHSMGGRAVASFTYLYPEYVEKLVIEDIGPDADPEAIAKIEALLDGIPSPFASKKEGKEFFFNDFVEKFKDRQQVRLLGQFLYSNFEDKPDGSFAWKFDPEVMRLCVQEGRSQDRFDQFAAIKVPTLLMRGERTEDLPVEVYERVLSENENIEGIQIADSGHWIHYDQADVFTQTIHDFFTRT